MMPVSNQFWFTDYRSPITDYRLPFPLRFRVETFRMNILSHLCIVD